MTKRTKQASDAELNEALDMKQPLMEITEDVPDGGQPPTGQPDSMALARAARARAAKNGTPRTMRLLYLCQHDDAGIITRVVKSFANKYRLRKWLAVAVDIDPSLRSRICVIRGKRLTVEEVVE